MAVKRFEASRLLGERLRDRRLALGLTQHELASLSQVDLANYGKVERGTGNPTILTILQLAASLEVEPGELLDGLADPELLPARKRPFSVHDFLKEHREREGG